MVRKLMKCGWCDGPLSEDGECNYCANPQPARKVVGYSPHVRERFDPERPKYTEAVKSIAAFCDKNNMTKLCFQVLVSHLDNACAEAVVRGRQHRTEAAGKRQVRLIRYRGTPDD